MKAFQPLFYDSLRWTSAIAAQSTSLVQHPCTFTKCGACGDNIIYQEYRLSNQFYSLMNPINTPHIFLAFFSRKFVLHPIFFDFEKYFFIW